MCNEIAIEFVSTIAWGNQRDPQTWTGSTISGPMFDRGFTGHEHLFSFGLINMNGRMYDPVMSSFLSVDSYVQSPENSQNFNRYAYCLNNPLKYKDPSGEVVVADDIIIGAIIGGIMNLGFQSWSGDVNNSGDAMIAFGIGAVSGAAGAWAGGAVSGSLSYGGFYAGAISGAAGGAAGGFMGSAGSAWHNGASFGQGLLAGIEGAGIGALTGALTGGLKRGIRAVAKGGRFKDGLTITYFDAIENDPFSGRFDIKYYNENVREYEEGLIKGVENEYNCSYEELSPKLKTTMRTSLKSIAYSDFIKENKITIENDGCYYHGDGKPTNGFCIGYEGCPFSEIHICPRVVDGYIYGYDIPHFKATVGHEMIHAYHYSIGLDGSSPESETVARNYSKSVYRNANLSVRATNVGSSLVGEVGKYALPTEIDNSFIYNLFKIR